MSLGLKARIGGVFLLSMAVVLGSQLGVFSNLRGASAQNGESVSVQFGEPTGSTLGRRDPQHLYVQDPGVVDKKSPLTFDMNTGAGHQVVVFAEGIQISDLSVPTTGSAVVTGTGPASGPPIGSGWLNPATDPLPEGVIAAGMPRADLTVEFQKKGTYLIICNVRSHFIDETTPMFMYLTVDQVNLNKN